MLAQQQNARKGHRSVSALGMLAMSICACSNTPPRPDIIAPEFVPDYPVFFESFSAETQSSYLIPPLETFLNNNISCSNCSSLITTELFSPVREPKLICPIVEPDISIIKSPAPSMLIENPRGGAPLPDKIPDAAASKSLPPPLLQRQLEQADQILPAAGEEEFETTLFDLYLADKQLGYILVRYTDSWCEIENAADVLEQFPKVRDAQSVREALTGRLPLTRTVPEVLSLRCDLNTFRILVNLDPSKVVSSKVSYTDKIPEPSSDSTLLQELQGAAITGLETNENASLNHRSVLSLGKIWGTFDGTVVKDSDYEVDDASATAIIGDYRFDSGLLQTNGTSFAGSVQYSGFSLRSAERVLRNEEALRGSRLEIFVPSKSQVSFYRGSRLLMTQILDYGLREINTSTFPQGSYLVDVVITEFNGQETREQHLFTKSGQLAVRGHPEIILQGGSIRDELDFDETPVYQAKVAYRLLGALQVDTSIAGDDTLTIGSVGMLGLWREFLYTAEVGFSDYGNLGYSASLGGNIFGLNLSASYLTNVVNNPTEDIVRADEEQSPFVQQRQNLNLIGQERTSVNAAVSYFPHSDIELRYSVLHNKNPLLNTSNPFDHNPEIDEDDQDQDVDEIDKKYSYGPSITWRILSGIEHQLRLQLAMFNTDRGSETSLYLGYNFTMPRSPWSNASSALITKEQSSTRSHLNAMQQYSTKTPEDYGSEVQVEGQFDVRSEGESAGLAGLSAENKNGYSNLLGFVRETTSKDDSNTTAGINLASAAFIDGKRNISVVAPSRSTAFAIVEIESTTPTLSVEILLDNVVRERVSPGNRRAIGVTPYEIHSLSIRPAAGSEMIEYDSEPFTFVAFPGNIVRKVWQVDKIFIALGKVVDEFNHPIGMRRIRGARGYVVSEEDGLFQAEVTGNEELYIEHDGNRCVLALESKPPSDYFVDYGTVVCKMANEKPRKAVELGENNSAIPISPD